MTQTIDLPLVEAHHATILANAGTDVVHFEPVLIFPAGFGFADPIRRVADLPGAVEADDDDALSPEEIGQLRKALEDA